MVEWKRSLSPLAKYFIPPKHHLTCTQSRYALLGGSGGVGLSDILYTVLVNEVAAIFVHVHREKELRYVVHSRSILVGLLVAAVRLL